MKKTCTKNSQPTPQLVENGKKYESPKVRASKMVEPVSIASNCSSKLTLRLDDLIIKSEKPQVAVYKVNLH